MDCTFSYLSYRETNSFSKLLVDYLDTPSKLASFFTYTPNKEGVEEAIKERKKYQVDRKALVQTLQKQYKHLEQTPAVTHNINALAKDNTYTVCTAHQPNLLTGYLYFIYKIIHAIKLAEELNNNSDKHFVPVYYMGSEDNDLEELGVFKYDGDVYRWDADGQTGAVGRMTTKSLKPLLNQLFKTLGPPSKHTDELKEILTEAYLKQNSISDATQYLVNALFGKYGLIVLNPDESSFKKSIIPIIEDDLLQHNANTLVTAEIDRLEQKGYKSQAYPRAINLFYLIDGLRERIERNGNEWTVINSDIKWTKEAMLAELKQYPERFSPNVILRGVFQETIMPNVAFIGGGAEVAYWMQLKTTFEHYNTFYPAILPRQSALWIDQKYVALKNELEVSLPELFINIDELVRKYVSEHSKSDWQTTEEKKLFEKTMISIKEKATVLDPTLEASTEAALAKIRRQLVTLEKKMLRAEKRKMDIAIKRITKLKQALFPNNSLQERKENFISYYSIHGNDFITQLHRGTNPYSDKFLVVEQEG